MSDERINCETLAGYLGITVRAVNKLRVDGVIPYAEIGDKALYDPRTAIPAYIKYKTAESKSKSEEVEMLSPEGLSKYIGITGRAIQNLFKSGVLTGEVKGSRYYFNPYVAIPQFIEYQKSLVAPEDSKERKLAAEADLKRAQADIAQLELAELRGEMHRSDDVKYLIADAFAKFRAELLALIQRVPVILEVENKAQGSQTMSVEVAAILERLKGIFEYDPKKYRDLVRERAGWKEIINEEDEQEE